MGDLIFFGGSAIKALPIIPASNYRGEFITEYNATSLITCSTANELYDFGDIYLEVNGDPINPIDDPIYPIDSPYSLTHIELIVSLNDFATPTGSEEAVTISLFRDDSEDGTPISGKTLIDKFQMVNQSIVRIPLIHIWNSKRFKFSSSVAGSILNVTIKGLYFIPS